MRKKIFWKAGLFAFVICLLLLGYKTEYQAATGYSEYGHNWETPSKCGTCGGDHVVTTSKTCSTCSGRGMSYRCITSSSHYNSQTKVSQCPICSNVVAHLSCSTCGGDGKLSSNSNCLKCYASGTYKGKNTRCTNSGCSKSSYGAWSDYPDGVCNKIAKTVKVTFNKNDGTGSTVSQTFTYDVSNQKFGYNTDGTAKWGTSGQFGTWDRDGYKLLGWSTNKNATKASYSVYSGVANSWIAENTPNITLYAVWGTCAHDSFTITEYFLGIEVKRACDTCGQIQVPTWFTAAEGVDGYTTDPIWHGYDGNIGGISWMFDDDGNLTYAGVWHDIGTEVTISVNMEDNDDYAFSCFTNGGEHTTESSYSYTKNNAATWTANVWKTLYWNGIIVGREKSCSVCGDETETAVWIDTNGYDVTVGNPNYSDFGQADDILLYFYPSNETVSFTVSGEEGYTYYWTQNNVDYTDTISFNMDSATSITANRTKNAYTVTYNVNGGTFTDGTIANKTTTVDYGNEVSLDLTCEKEGYKFVGWAEKPSDEKTISYLEMPASDITLYAMYSLPVSDVKECLLVVWGETDLSNYKTYPMEMIGTNIRGYTYSLEGIDITKGLNYSSTDEIKWKIIIYDNAGNSTELYPNNEPIPPSPDVPEKYLQTVMHYIWNMELKDWQYLTSTDMLIEEGEIFIPQYLNASDENYPVGYHTSSIDTSYTVTGPKTSNAYYMPNEYKLYFDANGGNCDTEYKTVYYSYFYGELPDAGNVTRPGHDFLGWFTEPVGGLQISSADKYTKLEDSTVYAHWQIHSHNVVYDYWTNGGSSVSSTTAIVNYGQQIDLSVTANKSGWEFVGWNTNPDATVGLKEGQEESIMQDEDATLYAIYKRNITATFIDKDETKSITRTISNTIFNQETEVTVSVPEQNDISGWDCLGWSQDVEADAGVAVSSGSEVIISSNITYYGCYGTDVTLRYDTNGSSMEIVSQTQKRFFNSYGNYSNPMFTIGTAPILADHSFVVWVDDVRAVSYKPEEIVEMAEDTLLIAKWDKYPEIEAFDRYFTLEQAKNGEITESELLDKVVGTDKEDGTLVNGTDVIVKDYNASVFTSIATDEEEEITYQATDSFGNTVTKAVIIKVTDTSMKKSTKKSYIRFISSQFFADNKGNLVSSSQGGLEETSIWRINSNYFNLLQNTLLNKKNNVETKIVSAFGCEWEVEIEGSGEWEEKEEIWVFDRKDIQKMKSYISTYGHILNSVEKFYEQFRGCKVE